MYKSPVKTMLIENLVPEASDMYVKVQKVDVRVCACQ